MKNIPGLVLASFVLLFARQSGAQTISITCEFPLVEASGTFLIDLQSRTVNGRRPEDFRLDDASVSWVFAKTYSDGSKGTHDAYRITVDRFTLKAHALAGHGGGATGTCRVVQPGSRVF